VDVTIKSIKCRKINNVEKYFFEKKLKQKDLGKKVRLRDLEVGPF